MAVMPSGNAALPDTKKWIIDILPSEYAVSYKMKLGAVKRQDFRTDLTSSQLVTKLRTDDFANGRRGKTALTSVVGAALFEEQGTGTAANILFSDGKCKNGIRVENTKNLFAALKKRTG